MGENENLFKVFYLYYLMEAIQVCGVGTIHLILPLRKWDLGKMNLSNNHMAHTWQKWEWTLGSLMQAELFITVGSVSFVNGVSQ